MPIEPHKPQTVNHKNITLQNYSSNNNHRLKSAVDMPIRVLKIGDLCDRMSSCENEARFLHQNEICATKKQNGCQPQCVHKHKIRLAVSHSQPQL